MFGTDLWVVCAGASLIWGAAWSLASIVIRAAAR